MEGEFDRGSARQYAEANIDAKDFKDQDLRRSNFTSGGWNPTCEAVGALTRPRRSAQVLYIISSHSQVHAYAPLPAISLAASAKRANFTGANLQGAYFMKSVLYQADFTGANLSDTLMDRCGLCCGTTRHCSQGREPSLAMAAASR